ncbi:MAG: ergothioneine biosynthesis protein EgtB [Wenzhouxiangella sp.]
MSSVQFVRSALNAIDPQAAIERRFEQVRSVTTMLAEPLSPEDCVVQSVPDASPVKWHLAHTSWFFETFLLEPFEPNFKPFDPAFRVLYNSYYEGVGDKHPRPERGLVTRPDLETVKAYRRSVDERLLTLLQSGRMVDEALELVELGLHHEQQHQELILTDLKHLFSRNPLNPAYRPGWRPASLANTAAGWQAFEGGLVEIGHSGGGFAFDNESPRHKVWLEPFELASHPVSNGQYLDFINDGGYRRPELWLSAGWRTIQENDWQAPLYWRQRDGQWYVFTLHGEMPIDPDSPVCHLCFYEAEAFARWAGGRLPTEAEWEWAASQQLPGDHGNFLESGAFHPLAAGQPRPDGQLGQLFGDVWEWTRSEYAPYPGFAPAAGAVGEYNGKFMSDQYVLRGGSCVTPRNHIRASYRNFMPATARWQFSGLRLAR